MVKSELRKILHNNNDLKLENTKVIIARVFYAENGKVVSYVPITEKSICSESGVFEEWQEENARLFSMEMLEALNKRTLTEEDFI